MCITKLLLVCYFAGITLAKSEREVKHWFIQQGAQCITDHAITDEEFQLMYNHTVPDSKNAKCFLTCLFTKTEWIDDKGMFSEENAIKTAERNHSDEPIKIENAKKLFTLCKTVNDETYSDADGDCERGASLAKCLVQNAPKMGLNLQ